MNGEELVYEGTAWSIIFLTYHSQSLLSPLCVSESVGAMTERREE